MIILVLTSSTIIVTTTATTSTTAAATTTTTTATPPPPTATTSPRALNAINAKHHSAMLGARHCRRKGRSESLQADLPQARSSSGFRV